MFRFQIKKTKNQKSSVFFPKNNMNFIIPLRTPKMSAKKRYPAPSGVISHGSQDKFPHVTYSTYCHTFESPKSSPRLPSAKSPKITENPPGPPRCLGDLCFSKRSGHFQLCRHLAATETRRLRSHQVVHASGLEYENQRRGRNHGKKNMEKQLYTCKNM